MPGRASSQRPHRLRASGREGRSSRPRTRRRGRSSSVGRSAGRTGTPRAGGIAPRPVRVSITRAAASSVCAPASVNREAAELYPLHPGRRSGRVIARSSRNWRHRNRLRGGAVARPGRDRSCSPCSASRWPRPPARRRRRSALGASYGLVNDVDDSFSLDGFKPSEVTRVVRLPHGEDDAAAHDVRLDVDRAGRIAGQTVTTPGGSVTMPGYKERINYITVDVSYRSSEGFFTSGLFGGIGGYRSIRSRCRPSSRPTRT